MHSKLLSGDVMEERKIFFGSDRNMIERIDSLDSKWFVEFWIIRYYFMGIEVFTRKKEIVKHNLDLTENKQKSYN
ncbi:MAG: hypothetical protein AB9846_16755 [Tenuifilaceae bacterium]